ncbi:MAG: hypothetical protein V3T55_05090, partial [Anaerolineales bacterium]
AFTSGSIDLDHRCFHPLHNQSNFPMFKPLAQHTAGSKRDSSSLCSQILESYKLYVMLNEVKHLVL